MTTPRPVPLVRRFYRDLADGTAGRIEEKAQAAVAGVDVLEVDDGELREAWLEDLACVAGYVLVVPLVLSETSTSRAEDAWVWVATAEAGLALRSALQREDRWRMIAADEVQPYRASALVRFEPPVEATLHAVAARCMAQEQEEDREPWSLLRTAGDLAAELEEVAAGLAQCGEEGWSRRAGEAAERLRRCVDGFPGTELEEVGREHRQAVRAYRETWAL